MKYFITVVFNQIGTPTYTYDFARLLVDMTETDKHCYYHATNEGGYISWTDFVKEIFKQVDKDVKVTPVAIVEYGASKAVRLFNSYLNKSKLVGSCFKTFSTWQDALLRYLKLINIEGLGS